MDAVFDRFVRSMDEIEETWQLIDFFENELQKFKDEVSSYESDILKEQNTLKKLREEHLQLQHSIKIVKNELDSLNSDKNTKLEINTNNINTVPIRALQKVDIRLKDGIIVKANPAYDVYSKDIVERYIANLREVKSLKSKLLEVEFENAKLKNELRELKS